MKIDTGKLRQEISSLESQIESGERDIEQQLAGQIKRNKKMLRLYFSVDGRGAEDDISKSLKDHLNIWTNYAKHS